MKILEPKNDKQRDEMTAALESRRRPRSDCFNIDGRPKMAFGTRALARKAEREVAMNHNGERLRAYPCPEHGYHLGHLLKEDR